MDAANPSTAQTLEACPRTIESFPSPELEELNNVGESSDRLPADAEESSES